MLGVGGRESSDSIRRDLKQETRTLDPPNLIPGRRNTRAAEHSRTESTDQTSNLKEASLGRLTGTEGAYSQTQTSLRKHNQNTKRGYIGFIISSSPFSPPSSSLVSSFPVSPLLPAWTLILRMLPPAADKEGKLPATSDPPWNLSSSHLLKEKGTSTFLAAPGVGSDGPDLGHVSS